MKKLPMAMAGTKQNKCQYLDYNPKYEIHAHEYILIKTNV